MGDPKRYKRVPNYKRIIIFVILLALTVFTIFTLAKGFTKENISNSNNSETNNESQSTIAPIKDTTINLVAIGDVMCHSTNFKGAYNATTKTYDFNPAFEDIKKYTENADITVGNLETTFAPDSVAYSGYPTFNSPKELGVALKNIGVDVLSTANNHSLDKGYTGLTSTIDRLDEIGLDHMGTYQSAEEQEQILIKDVNGIRIAFLSYTYGTNGIPVPKGKEYCVNLIDKTLISKQIKQAKEQEVDLICVSMHWGDEYKLKQNSTQEQLADFLFKEGADIILGSHPHVLEPMEKRTITLEDGTTKDGFVIYSLGNFISGQVIANTKNTIILNLKLTKHGDSGKITIDDYKYTPVYCYDKGAGTANRYKLIDIRTAVEDYIAGKQNISSGLYSTIKAELKKIEAIMEPSK